MFTYIASVSKACCKRLFKMFHLFQTYVAGVLIWMFAFVSHICCNNMFHVFHMFQAYVASVLFGCCICYNDYVASVCYKCFIYFNRMLQLFHVSVAKVDLNVGLFSEEERASAGSPGGADCKLAAALHRRTRRRPRWRTRPVPYDMLPPLDLSKVLEWHLPARRRCIPWLWR